MNILQIITQIQSIATYFNNNVSGAAEYANAVNNNEKMVYPSAFVVNTMETAGEIETYGGFIQNCTYHFSVYVVVNASLDRGGLNGMQQLEIAKASLFSAILYWNPDPNNSNRGIYYQGSQLVEFDKARIFYEFKFAYDLIISSANGYQVPSYSLTQIQMKEPIGNTLTQDVNFP